MTTESESAVRGKHDEITNVIRHHWDRRACSFDGEIGHGLVSEDQHRAWLALLSRLAGPAPQRVLDVGCGTGFLALLFAELGHTVTGIDLAPQMLDRARQKAEQANQQIDFRVGNATALDQPDETYDLVVARHLIWTLPVPENGVSEWLRVLRRGGRLALIEGKWGHNDAMALGHAAPARRRLTTLVDEGMTLVSRRTRLNVRWFCGPRYRRVEAELPFSGGPPAERLTALLQAQQVIGVEVEPLMDPVLWGETPQFPRYLVSGTRPMT